MKTGKQRLGIVLTAAAVLNVMGCSRECQTSAPLELVGYVQDDEALNRPHDVELQGDLAFVPGKGGSLAVIDVSDPARPAIVSSLVDPAGLEDAETVLPRGDVLLLGARDLLAIDISSPANPVIVKRISDRPRIDRINGMAVIGEYLFTANKSGYVSVFDIRDPAAPQYLGAYDAAGLAGQQKPHDIAADGDRIVVVDAARTSPASVCIYRVMDGATGALLPFDQWEILGTVASGNQLLLDLGGANRVGLAGGYACVGAFVCDRVGVVDIRSPRTPAQIANMPVCDVGANGLEIAGQALLVAGGECVEVIDISDPARPVSVAQYRNGELFPTRRIDLDGLPRYDNAHDLVYRDGYVYVTAQNDNRFGVLRVSGKARELAGAKD